MQRFTRNLSRCALTAATRRSILVTPISSAVLPSSLGAKHAFSSFRSSSIARDSHGDIPRNPQFSTLTPADVEHFTKIVGAENVLQDEFDIKPFNTDWMRKWSGKCKLVLRPTSTEQVSAILKHCNERSLAVVPQGGNTGLVGGSIPIHDEIVLSLGKMNKVIDLNSVQGIVTVEAGMVLQSLMDYLDPHGFIVPLDLGAKGSCQIGGNVSTNAGGLRYVRYGSLHGTVLGLEAVLADGTVVDTLNTLRKDNTGYDLKQLFIGAEGSLGVVTKVALLVPRKPSSINVLYLSLPSYKAVLQTMALAKDSLMEILSAIEFKDTASLQLVLKHQGQFGAKLPFEEEPEDPAAQADTDLNGNGHGRFYMLIETSGSNREHDQAKINAFLERLYEEVEGVNGAMAESESQAAGLWRLRESVAESAGKEGYVYKYDISLPVSEMWRVTCQVKERLRETGALTFGYGHLGDGNLHINVVTKGKDDRVLALLEPWLFEQLRDMRGSISAEHGLGQAKNEFIHYSKADGAVSLMKGIKALMDPKGILNPYKVLPK